MATNFEFYKDQLLGYAEEYASVPALVNGKLVTCTSDRCQQCIFRSPNCFAKRVEWLYAEHIEASKLTKRERAFCEAVQTGWIARNEDGQLHWFGDKHEPIKNNGQWVRQLEYIDDLTVYNTVNKNWVIFNFIKREDEKPWDVADLLKLEVE